MTPNGMMLDGVIAMISISPETERLIAAGLEQTGFTSADALVQSALHSYLEDLESDEELDDETQAAIAEGEAQIARGETIPWESVRGRFLERARKG